MHRRSPRAVLLWLAATTVAVATAAVVATDLASLHRRARALGPLREVAVAAHDLNTGTTLRGDALTTRHVHASQLPVGAVSPSQARGRVVALPVAGGAFVVAHNLAPRHRHGLQGVIPAGMRALRIVTGDSIRPPVGGSVDVLVTFDPAVGSGSPDRSPTVVAARGVLVLAIDDGETGSGSPASAGGAGGARGQRGIGATLLVTEADAQRVAFAAATGVVTLALDPPEDAMPAPDG